MKLPNIVPGGKARLWRGAWGEVFVIALNNKGDSNPAWWGDRYAKDLDAPAIMVLYDKRSKTT